MALQHLADGVNTYTNVGNVTIANGIASGFADNKFLQIRENIEIPANTDFAVQACFKPTNSSVTAGNGEGVLYLGAYDNPLTYNTGIGVAQGDGRDLYVRLPDVLSGETERQFAGVLTLNVFNYIQLSLRGKVFTIKHSLNGSSWTTLGSYQSSVTGALETSIYPMIGVREGEDYPFSGEIDLNNTWISIGNVAWFGKAPVEVKKVVRQDSYPAEVSGVDSLSLPIAKANSLSEVKLYGDTELLPETYLDTVTLSGGCRQSNLPEGYTQVEYLDSAVSGSYFLTGINATVDTDMGITASNITSASAQLLVAQCVSGSDYFRIAKATATQRIIANFGASSVTDNNTTGVNKFTARVNKSGFYVDGSLVGTFSNIPSSFTGVGAVDIFRGRYSDTAYYANPGSRFYSAWVDDNVFLPCRRNSDNQLGIYNTKTGQFILPSVADGFTAGPDVTTPTPDTPMDIVCNNGAIKVSKNVFDYEYFYDNYQTYTSSAVGRCPIKLKANTQYTVSTNSASSSTSARVFVVSGSAINWSPNSADNGILINSPRTVTTDSSGYLCLGIYVSGNNAIPESDFVNGTVWVQIEQGNTATPYMPYGQIYVDGTVEVVTDSLGNTANAEMLLSAGNYKDTQEVLAGSVTKRIGIKVLDGTDTWSTDTYGGYRRFYLPNTAKAELSTAFCTHYSSNAEEGSRITPNNVYISSTGAFVIYIASDQTFTTSEEFNTWLAEQYAQGTPVIIAYPLATATTESVTSQFLSKSPVTQTAGSISSLPIAITESQKTVPTPTQPLDINCNNGVLSIDGQGNITVTGTTETVTIDTTGDTATAEMLLKVGTYQDIHSVIDGEVTRNVGIKVFDGTENWTAGKVGAIYRYTVQVQDIEVSPSRGSVLSTHFIDISSTSAQTVGGIFSNVRTVYIIPEQNLTTVASFKQYLSDQYNAGTPVIIVYPLATPTTETVTAQPMNIQAGTNTLSVTQASMSGLGLSAKYNQSERDVNYVVKDGKLVFADPRIYLAGPVNYTVVGNPTIVDGVASGFVGRSAYLELSDSVTYSSSSNLKIHIKFKTGTLTAVRAPIIQCDNMGGNSLLYTYGSYLYCMPYAGISDVIYTDTQSNTWYSVDIAVNNDTTECKLYNASGTLLATKTFTSQFSSVTYRFYFGLQYGYDPEDLLVVDSIDLDETYIQKNNTLLFYGKNYASKNIAPVPSGYTYGTTTTSAIGYVDMTTQQFTAAPSGSVIGRDE